MQYRAVRGAELNEVRALAHAIWREYYPPIIGAAQVEYMLDRFYSQAALEADLERGTVYELVVEDGRAIGYLAYGLIERGIFKLHKLYLVASARGRGIGRRVLARVEAACSGVLEVNVNKNNALAIGCYERAGFQRSEAVTIDIGNGFAMDDYVYKKVRATG